VSAKVVVAEDDRAVRESLERALSYEGYEVITASDGAAAIQAALNDKPDAIVLDVMMPHVDGLDVAKRLRKAGMSTPILMLTARVKITDRVSGLDAGADDYLVKPFALEELLARLRALLRRGSLAESEEVLRVDDLTLDPRTREVRRGDRTIELTKTEFALLELLMANRKRVMTRSQIYERVWDYDFGPSSNSLEVYVGYLRRKMGDPRLLHTVRGVGYVMRESDT
jgi:two-component system, OmpR family, response regulator MprA